AADETSASLSSTVHHDDFDPDIEFHDFHPHSSSHILSRLSVCTSSMYTTTTDDDDEESMSRMFMSGFSIDSCFDTDAENDEPRRQNQNLDLI
ncbi:hypothetical protein LINPERPRIM_LOCUS5672, partial [Linum perenne]